MKSSETKFEIRDTYENKVKRLIIYYGESGERSEGFKCKEQDLYNLYMELRDFFKDKDK